MSSLLRDKETAERLMAVPDCRPEGSGRGQGARKEKTRPPLELAAEGVRRSPRFPPKCHSLPSPKLTIDPLDCSKDEHTELLVHFYKTSRVLSPQDNTPLAQSISPTKFFADSPGHMSPMGFPQGFQNNFFRFPDEIGEGLPWDQLSSPGITPPKQPRS